MAVKRKQMKKKTLVLGRKRATQQPAQELTRLGSALRTLGGLGGGAVGSLIGMGGAGSAAGSSLGATISKWLGSGDYEVSTNSVVGQSLKSSNGVPFMHKEGQSVTIRHKEFVTEVRGSQAFNVRASFEINPGRAETFPWLAGIASRFQEYRIKGMVWHYVPTSGNAVASTNAALGSVMLQTSYRSNDSIPVNKVEVLNEYWSSESVPSEAFCHPIECDPNENPFNVQYVRTNAVPDGDSELMYDLGVTHLCVSGQQVDDTVLGDLWVTYEIELKKPIIESNVTNAYKVCDLLYTGTMTSASYFNGTELRRGNLECSANVKTLSFPPQLTGIYMVTVNIVATSVFTAVSLGGSLTLTNCTNLPMPNGSSYVRTEMPTNSLNVATIQTIVQIPDKAKQASITFPGSFTGASTISWISVSPYNVYF